jgi:Recombination endonuclease VII
MDKKARRRATMKKWRAANPRSDGHRAERYGITEAQYKCILSLQHGACAICRLPETCKGSKGKVRPLTVDHDHRTGEVRGLLCNKCNVGIGNLRDSVLLLQSAIAYLESDHQHIKLVKTFF